MYNTIEVLYMKKSGIYQIKCRKNGKIYVRHARTSADMDLNIERMEQIRDGILKLV